MIYKRMKNDRKAAIVVTLLIILTIAAYPFTSTEEYLFCWDDVPDWNAELIKFLKNEIKAEWVEDAEIKKSESDMFTYITKEENSIVLKLIAKEGKVILITENKTYEYSIVKEGKKLNVYKYNWQIYGIQSYSFFREGKFEPLITAIFTHLDEWHIFGNMVFLFVFGITLATFIGWKKFLVIYFIGGIAGNLAWVIYPVIDEGAASVTAVGASGAVFAVMAALAMAKPKNADEIAKKSEILKFFSYVPGVGLIYELVMGEGILGFIGIIFYFLFVTVPDLILGGATAHAVHFGGLLAGLVLGYLFKCKNDFETDENAKHGDNEKKYDALMPVHDYDGFLK